jgi:hypothetical protein
VSSLSFGEIGGLTGKRKHVLFTANYTKLYRHSFYADYYIFNVEDKTTVPLVEDQVGGKLNSYSICNTADF